MPMVANLWKPFKRLIKSRSRMVITQFRKSDGLVSQKDSCRKNENEDIRKRYKISTKILGQGQFGYVYRGVDSVTGKNIAVKRISRFRAKHADIRGEVNVLQDVSHPYIIKALGLFHSSLYWNIVLELAEGISLYQWISNVTENFSIERELLAAHKIISAVAFLHSADIVHGDLKPQNVMISASGDEINVKLIDFGSAYHVGDGHSRPHDFTPAYAPPELLRLTRIGKPTDIWACGLMCFMLLERHHPFDRHSKENTKDIKRRTLKDDPHYSDVWNLVHPEIQELNRMALSKDYSQRPRALELFRANWTLKY